MTLNIASGSGLDVSPDPGQTFAPPAAQAATPALILADAHQWENAAVPYLWAGDSDAGADCSGYVKTVYAEMGDAIAGRSTYQQVTLGAEVPGGLANAQPADVLFFTVGGAPNEHEGLYAGVDASGIPYMYDEPQTGGHAELVPVPQGADMFVDDVRRFINADGSAAGPGVTVGATPEVGFDHQLPTGTGAVGTAAATTPATATLTGFNPLSAKDWKGVGAYIVLVGAGLGLCALGAYKIASPGASLRSIVKPSPPPGGTRNG